MTQPFLFTVGRETDHTQEFFNLLSDGCWHRGRDLRDQLGTDERTLRQIASDSRGAVISSEAGYRLTRCASVDEIDHAEARLLSQAKRMKARAVQIRRARNQGGRAA